MKGYWRAIMTAGLLVLAGLAVVAAGCGSKANRIRAPKAAAYVCENCGYKFGLPQSTPVKELVWAPFVCPKCKKRATARAHIYQPKAGGEPEVLYYTKFTDDQIKRMIAYRDSADEKQLRQNPPDSILDTMTESPLRRNEGSKDWYSPIEAPQMLKMVDPAKYVLIEAFPKDWPIQDGKPDQGL